MSNPWVPQNSTGRAEFSMPPRLEHTELEISTVPGHPGRRRLAVRYVVACDQAELVGLTIKERITVHGVSVEDTPVATSEAPIMVVEGSFAVETLATHRQHEQNVHRADLDVERDWWSTGQGGETVAIAEWVDHLVAEITLASDGVLLDVATTPVVSGSWGALGES